MLTAALPRTRIVSERDVVHLATAVIDGSVIVVRWLEGGGIDGVGGVMQRRWWC